MRIVTAREIEAIERVQAESEADDGPTGGGMNISSFSSGRRVVNPERRPDTLYERAIGLIPAAAITVWLALTGVAPQSLGQSAEWITLAVSWIVCVAVLWRTTAEPKNIKSEIKTPVGERTRVAQIVIPTLMFPLYVYTIGGPFDEFVWYDPALGTYLLVVILVLASVLFPSVASIGLSADENQPT